MHLKAFFERPPPGGLSALAKSAIGSHGANLIVSSHIAKGLEAMLRKIFISVAVALAVWPIAALAQQATGPRLESPGEISVWSTVLTQKQEYCRRQARAQKLGYWKRRRFVRDCVKHEMSGR